MKKQQLAFIGGMSAIIIAGVGLSHYMGGMNLRSDSLNVEPICYLQSEIDEKNNEKIQLLGEIEGIQNQKIQLEEKVNANDVEIARIKTEIAGVEEKIIDDATLEAEKIKIGNLENQRDKKRELETLLNEVESKKVISDTDKRDYEKLFLAIAPVQKKYDTLSVQYDKKVEIETIKDELKNMIKPNQAHLSARKTLEAYGTPEIKTKRPSEEQISDRLLLEKQDTAQKTAKNKIPAKNHKNYATLLEVYNKAEAVYKSSLEAYATKYAESDFGVTQSSAALKVAVTNYNKYNTVLTNYLKKYPLHSSLTYAQLQEEMTKYGKIDANYRKIVADYNVLYKSAHRRSPDARSAAEILIVRDEAKKELESVRPSYESMKHTYDTVSLPAYEGALEKYQTTLEQYNQTYNSSKLTSDELIKELNDLQAKYETLTTVNNTHKEVLSGLIINQDEYGIIGMRLDGEKNDMENILARKSAELAELEVKISNSSSNLCPSTETYYCRDNTDNDRDGVKDCDDSDCSSTSECQIGEPESTQGGGNVTSVALIETVCNNHTDDDFDSYLDCDDTDCSLNPVCQTLNDSTTISASQGIDNTNGTDNNVDGQNKDEEEKEDACGGRKAICGSDSYNPCSTGTTDAELGENAKSWTCILKDKKGEFCSNSTVTCGSEKEEEEEEEEEKEICDCVKSTEEILDENNETVLITVQTCNTKYAKIKSSLHQSTESRTPFEDQRHQYAIDDVFNLGPEYFRGNCRP